MAAALWHGGISFGGVIAFIFADLLILPILVIYRKYYGGRMAVFLFATFYLASVVAGYIVEITFGVLGLIPSERNARIEMADVSWNYTTFLNIGFLLLAALLIIRFVRTGGMRMLTMMGGGPDNAPAADGSSASAGATAPARRRFARPSDRHIHRNE